MMLRLLVGGEAAPHKQSACRGRSHRCRRAAHHHQQTTPSPPVAIGGDVPLIGPKLQAASQPALSRRRLLARGRPPLHNNKCKNNIRRKKYYHFNPSLGRLLAGGPRLNFCCCCLFFFFFYYHFNPSSRKRSKTLTAHRSGMRVGFDIYKL